MSKIVGSQVGSVKIGGGVAASYEDMILALGALAGYWPLHEPSGPTALDLSGNVRNGTYGGNVTFSDPGLIVGGQDSAYFSDPDDNIVNGVSVASNAAFNMGAGGTWGLWFKRPTGSGFFHYLFNRWDLGGNGWFLWMGLDSKFEVSIRNGGTVYELKYNGATYRDGLRHSAFVTQDSGKVVRIYIDGVEVANGTSTVFPASTSQVLLMNYDQEPINSQGWLGECFLLPGTVLSPGQIADLHARGVS